MSIQPYYERDGITIFHGDCVDVLGRLPDNSIDSVVTDPPYELGFMGKRWDSSGIAYSVSMWAEVLRVLKPGGHMLAFGGTRTYHRMTVAIEDAGFEIRDCLQWLYGSGFPKSHDVSKAIDKAAGAQREVVGTNPNSRPAKRVGGAGFDAAIGGAPLGVMSVTAPATPEAERWQGWGTSLKPANEPIVLARKPLSEPTVAANVLRWGTGALNVDATRVGTETLPAQRAGQARIGTFQRHDMVTPERSGRWPANVILSHSLFCTDDACDPSCAVALLDAQSGVSKSTDRPRHNGEFKSPAKGYETPHTTYGHNDSGGASRYYYVAKASRRERGEGNNHPTVKPVDLMRYLVRLITPPGGTVLDPFGGSGTTALACLAEGFECVLIEREQDYAQIAESRIAQWAAN